MDPLRVVFYAHRYLPAGGGVETATTHLSEALLDRGVDVVVATSTPAGAPGYPRARLVHGPTPTALARLFRGADVVHLQGFATLPTTLALLSGSPVVWDHHDFDLVCPKSIAWWGRACTYGPVQCTRDLTRDHPPSAVVGLQATLALRGLFARHRRVRHVVHSRFVLDQNGPRGASVVPYGIPRTIPRAASSRRSRRIVATGRLIPEKGFEVLLEALAAPRSQALGFEATIVGAGPEAESLARRARDLGVADRVRFLGRLHGPDLDRAFDGALAVVVPSIWDEPFGIVALEGMARGLPVVASAAGGLGELAVAGGVAVPREDPSALAEALERLATDAGHYDAVVAKGATLAKSWTWAALADEYLAVYREAITGARKAGRRGAGSPHTGVASPD